jgi:hypothetical protein
MDVQTEDVGIVWKSLKVSKTIGKETAITHYSRPFPGPDKY